MFHTFTICNSPPPAAPPNPRKRTKSPLAHDVAEIRRACEECRRRKIRCNRSQPCQACLYYKKPKLCRYAEAKPSQSKLAAVGRQYRAVLERLFPSNLPESLLYLSREELVRLVLQDQLQDDRLETEMSLPKESEEPCSPLPPAGDTNTPHEEDVCLEALQSMPEVNSDGRDSEASGLAVSISDDVNALSLSARQPSSYLGVSSVNAVIKVIMWIDPASLSYLSSPPPHRPGPLSKITEESSSGFHPSKPAEETTVPSVSPLQDDAAFSLPTGLQYIDAYFDYVHPFVPMLDEAQFRSTYLSGHRQDDRWKVLLNVVFALGSALVCPQQDKSHLIYFRRALELLNLESLGKFHLETVQALGLMAGHYLHYVSQPNLAYSLMGAALRMATALGMHREFGDYRPEEGSPQPPESSADLRRRVWWSLFCMDTWGNMTLGRPPLGRWGPAITVKPPQADDQSPFTSIALREHVRFCTIATQIQHALATSPQLPFTEIAAFDKKLTTWHAQLPAVLKDSSRAHSDSIATVQSNMHWRYLNCRMLLHRPTLLHYAMRRIPYASLRREERTTIERCRSVARETIHSIAATRLRNQTAAWGGVWYILQATMVPLLGLFITDPTISIVEPCKAEVEVTMSTLARLEAHTPTATRVQEVLEHIHNAAMQRPRPIRGLPLPLPPPATCSLPSPPPPPLTHSLGKRTPGYGHSDRGERRFSIHHDGSSISTSTTDISQSTCSLPDAEAEHTPQRMINISGEGAVESEIPDDVSMSDSAAALMSFRTDSDSNATCAFSGDQSMWDYISWAGNTPWAAGFLDTQAPDDLIGLWAGCTASDWGVQSGLI